MTTKGTETFSGGRKPAVPVIAASAKNRKPRIRDERDADSLGRARAPESSLGGDHRGASNADSSSTSSVEVLTPRTLTVETKTFGASTEGASNGQDHASRIGDREATHNRPDLDPRSFLEWRPASGVEFCLVLTER